MKRLKCEITIGNLFFNYVTNVRINSSWDTLTDTAEIQLPSKITNRDNDFIKNIIKVNDAVTIKLGYHPNLVTRFIGYVSAVVPESPIKIMCEDEAFKLKQTTIKNYSKNNLTLEELITDNYTGETNIVDAVVGDFRIDRVTMIKVLQELKSKHKISSWFRDGVLNSGLAYDITGGSTQNFSFQRNIIDGRSLRKIDDSELDTVAHGISTQDDGSKVELYTYYKNNVITTVDEDPGGDLNTMTLPGLSEADLKELLERWLPNLYYTGFSGSFTTFGEPVVQHGDVANITDKKFPEKDGLYVIKSVQIDFGMGGYRQTIELDRGV